MRMNNRQALIVLFSAVALVGLRVSAADLPTLYWKGDCAGSVTNPANYCTDAKLTTRCTELPNGNEIWIQQNNMTMSIDDGMRDVLTRIGGVNTRSAQVPHGIIRGVL